MQATSVVLPVRTDSDSWRLLSPDGQALQQFSPAGHHQMLIQVFAWTPTGWQQTNGGWCWKGPARQRWAELCQQGWAQVKTFR
jgi:hypothetical protein